MQLRDAGIVDWCRPDAQQQLGRRPRHEQVLCREHTDVFQLEMSDWMCAGDVGSSSGASHPAAAASAPAARSCPAQDDDVQTPASLIASRDIMVGRSSGSLKTSAATAAVPAAGRIAAATWFKEVFPTILCRMRRLNRHVRTGQKCLPSEAIHHAAPPRQCTPSKPFWLAGMARQMLTATFEKPCRQECVLVDSIITLCIAQQACYMKTLPHSIRPD